MKRKPLVTVLMPAYNHEEYIDEAILSIVNQSYNNIEFILINDGSTDSTDKKIMNLYNKCKSRFENFVYINRKNKGLLKTLKEMEEYINGEYFMTFASDDISFLDRVEKQVEILNNNSNVALCYGNMVGIDNKSNIIKKYKTKHKVSGKVFSKLLERNFIPAPTVMMRTSVFKELGGYDLNFNYEDYPLWLKTARKYDIYFLNEELVCYRTHENNMSSDLLKTILEVENILLSWKNEDCFNYVIKRFYLKSFYELARSDYNYKVEAGDFMIKAKSSFYNPKFIKALFRFYFKKYQ